MQALGSAFIVPLDWSPKPFIRGRSHNGYYKRHWMMYMSYHLPLLVREAKKRETWQMSNQAWRNPLPRPTAVKGRSQHLDRGLPDSRELLLTTPLYCLSWLEIPEHQWCTCLGVGDCGLEVISMQIWVIKAFIPFCYNSSKNLPVWTRPTNMLPALCVYQINFMFVP